MCGVDADDEHTRRLVEPTGVSAREDDVPEGRRGTVPLTVVGVIESSLLRIEKAPKQGCEGAPDAWLVVHKAFAPGLRGIAEGDELIVITWLHRACRSVLEVYPRDGYVKAPAGVFATRTQHRPNPLGLHHVTVRASEGTRLRIGPIEAIDGTPVVDIKAVIGRADG